MAPFDRPYTTFYWSAIVGIVLSWIISEIKRYIGRKSRFFHTPLHSMPPLAGLRPNIVMPFPTEKLEWCGCPMVKKFEDTFRRFDRIPACDGRTDGQTDILRRRSPRYT